MLDQPDQQGELGWHAGRIDRLGRQDQQSDLGWQGRLDRIVQKCGLVWKARLDWLGRLDQQG